MPRHRAWQLREEHATRFGGEAQHAADDRRGGGGGGRVVLQEASYEHGRRHRLEQLHLGNIHCDRIGSTRVR
jgi:hypothetical protein